MYRTTLSALSGSLQRHSWWPLVIAAALTIPNSSVLAQGQSAAKPCDPAPARAVSVQGTVEARRVAQADWQAVKLYDTFCPGDSIRVEERSRADIALLNQSVLRLNANSTITVEAPKEARTGVVDLVRGAAHFFSRGPRSLEVKTPFTIAGVRGTEFFIGVDVDKTLLTVFEGTVVAENAAGSATLTDGQSAVAESGKAPVLRTIARPRDAVQWALYYPPVVYFRPDELPAGADWQGMTRNSLEAYRRGDLAKAFESIQTVPADVRDARFFAYRAQLLLAVGRVDEARGDIDRSLQLAPNDPNALSLLAIIDVTQNEKDKALDTAQKAVAAAPNSATARIALSYAQQARFDLPGARASVEKAVELDPANALAWARLAELQSSFGELDKSLVAAQKAVALEPNLSRTQTVLGFAFLTEVKTAQAREAFDKAITLDQADPLPRLGLGLSKIRDGKLDEGSRDLEIAASLDPNNAIVRSYLGKAYFEERRSPLDAREYTMAKQLDPKDPTPYFYDAIAKQTTNRPVEALRDVEKAIELNDNRAVYRSRLGLDQDRAARGASLGRIYDDLGFHQLGINEASESLSIDPANASAHRFLSDTYVGVRRNEIARVSELLQAQLLQDININPIQPSLTETNMNIVASGGPAQAGFNEFTPLFEHNQVRANVSGLVGSENTRGGEGVVSAIYDRVSLSAGAFHVETDGWRPNNGIRHDVYNVFAQAAISPALNVQLELRRQQSDVGDIDFDFDPDAFSPNAQRSLDQDIARVGLRYSPAPNSSILLSLAHSDRKEQILNSDEFTSVRARVADRGYQFEGQYLYRMDWFNVTGGFAYSDVDRNNQFSLASPGEPPFLEQSNQEGITHSRGYVYGYLNLPRSVTLTLGASYDDFAHKLNSADQKDLDLKMWNPKFGIQWQVTDALRLRGAAFRTVKPALINNRTIEPTQIAGFNQFFDDTNGTQAWRYGVGADWRATANLMVGAEATRRTLKVPILGGEGFVSEDQNEQLHRAYVFWTATDRLALRAEFVYDRFHSDRGILTDFGPVPQDLKTISVPVGMRYFDPNGLFAGLGFTYVHQDVERAPDSTFAGGSSRFVPVDAAVGYRFPKRLGVVSLQVTNLFDKKFRFQDDSFREFGDEMYTGPYFPKRRVVARLMLSF